MNYLKTTEKIAVENYPYGYTQKTTAYFSVEHANGKGFRSVFQTINPKTGALNKPKKSVYSPVRILKNEDGKITTHTLDFYGNEGQTKDIKFMEENFDLFTTKEIQSIAVNLLAITKGNVMAKVIYMNSDKNKLLPLYEKAIKALVEIANTGKNLFSEVTFDFEAIDALEDKNFKPFKVTSYSV